MYSRYILINKAKVPHYQAKVIKADKYSKSIWNIINDLIGKKIIK